MRLYLKIFLWFWLAVVVVSGTLVSLTQLTHSRADDDRRWREKYAPRVDMWATQEGRILRTGGPAALEKYIASFEMDPGVFNYVFDAEGHDVLGRQASPAVLATVATLAGAANGTQRANESERIIAQRIADTFGHSYVVVVDFPPPSILARSLPELLFQDSGGQPTDTSAIWRLVVVLVVAGVLCLALARNVVAPIERLRAATRDIASEHLTTRVDRTVLRRRDELGDLGQDFDRMAARIEGLVTAQRDLLADVSHALRSPIARLNVALGLARRVTPPQALAHLDRIERETERLNALIGQLLIMARVESGVDLEHRAIFNLETLIEDVAADADYEARIHGCAVVATAFPGTFMVNGVSGMLRGAIENVVRNAVRHAADGTTVEIVLERQQHPDGSETAVIQVLDRGPGVPAEALARMFTPFHRAHGESAGPNGTGLGLAITKRAFEIHGGTARAANRAGFGLAVTLELPLHPTDSRATEVVAPAATVNRVALTS